MKVFYQTTDGSCQEGDFDYFPVSDGFNGRHAFLVGGELVFRNLTSSRQHNFKDSEFILRARLFFNTDVLMPTAYAIHRGYLRTDDGSLLRYGGIDGPYACLLSTGTVEFHNISDDKDCKERQKQFMIDAKRCFSERFGYEGG